MKLSLTVMTAGKSAGQTIPITLSQFLIGRDSQCNLRPASPLVSKRHCAVLVKNGKISIRDFNSTNGTFVNNEPVKGERPLGPNDILKVGPLEFRVVIETTTPVNKPTPPPPAPTSSSDDDVAAMLLSLPEDAGVSSSSADSEVEVPSGSTVMDLVPPVSETNSGAKAETTEQPAAKKPDPAKASANTSQAAKAILEKYTRRSRS